MNLAPYFVRLKATKGLRKPFRAPWTDGADFRELPKTVWIYWGTGRATAPELVEICIRSWEVMNPGWKVVVLDDDSVPDYVDLSDTEAADLPIQKRANILRNRLIHTHGGVWADATVLCTVPLDHWVFWALQTDLFMFSRPSSSRMVATWFVMGLKGSPQAKAIDRALTRYLTDPPAYQQKRKPPFYNYHYLIEYIYLTDRAFRRRFRRMPKIWAWPAQEFQRWLQPNEYRPRGDYHDIRGVPVHKLDWKRDADLSELRTLLAGVDPRLAAI